MLRKGGDIKVLKFNQKLYICIVINNKIVNKYAN